MAIQLTLLDGSKQVARSQPNEGPVTLTGIVARVVFRSPDDSFVVVRFECDDGALIAAVGKRGSLSGVQEGQRLALTGKWGEHQKFGRQIAVTSYMVVLPTTLQEFERYLGAGSIKRLGPKTARLLTDHYGEQTPEILDQAIDNPMILCVVKGIGKKKASIIAAGWESQKGVEEVQTFLQGKGLSVAMAGKIHARYGSDSLSVVQKNPYRLADDIAGVGFKKADNVARSLEFPLDSPFRIQAAILHVLKDCQREGHMYVPLGELVSGAGALLGMPAGRVSEEVDALRLAERVYVDSSVVAGSDPAVYLASLYRQETLLADKIGRVLASPPSAVFANVAEQWDALCQQIPLLAPESKLDETQRGTAQAVLEHKLVVLSGGPGSGKTTTVDAVLDMCDHIGAKYLLCAPTGRAQKKLSEAVGGRPASTIHRLLRARPNGTYYHGKQRPLEADLIVVDEASMLEAALAWPLFRALPDDAHVLIVGDTDQLPPVGAGDVLRDIIASGVAKVVWLRENYRLGGTIIKNAYRIREDELPHWAADFRFEPADRECAGELVEDLVERRIPEEFGIATEDIMVLSPIRRGPAGVENLNLLLQNAVNPSAPGKLQWSRGHRMFRVGDRVMQTRNNYTLDIFNGDMGFIADMDLEEDGFSVEIDGEVVQFGSDDLDGLELAYAVTIHKSQGGEYPCVVVVMLTSHYKMLARNLFYTAISRAQQLVIVVGQKKAVAIAVKNNRVAERNSGLRARLAAGLSREWVFAGSTV